MIFFYWIEVATFPMIFELSALAIEMQYCIKYLAKENRILRRPETWINVLDSEK